MFYLTFKVQSMSFLLILVCLLLLVLLIVWCRLNEFISFLIVSVFAGLIFHIPADKIIGSIQKGIGDTLGSLVIIICLGAMLGKLVAGSGAAQRIAVTLVKIFGRNHIQWALMVTGFIIGIPLFYGVGFVLMIPLIFSVVYQYKLPAVYVGVPMLAALSVTHGFLPPHPSPTALVQQFHGSMGLTLLYGLVIAVPTIIIAGPLFARTLKHIVSKPLQTFQPENIEEAKLPGIANSFITSLLPVFLLILTTALPFITEGSSASFKSIVSFFADPAIVLLLSVLVATITLGTRMGKKMKDIAPLYTQAVKDVAMILLIIAGAGALKQVLADSGVSAEIASVLQTWPLHPLVLAWLIAAIIRMCVGSSTIAGLTTAGIIAPMMLHTHANPNLMVLSVGAGSLMFSHVNDSGFWMFKEYFNVSIGDTIRSWSVMETIVSVLGLIGVLVLNVIL